MRTSFTGRWFTLAVLCLGVGGSFAFLVGMSRMPVISNYLPEDYFKHALVGHVVLAIILWLILSTMMLWSYHFKTRVADYSFWLSAAGAVTVALTALSGSGEAVLNNYVPTLITPTFFIGLAFFFAGFCVNVFTYFGEAKAGLADDDMTLNALSTSVVIGAVLVAAVAVSLILFGRPSGEYHPTAFYERLFWTPGHIQQVLNGSLLVAVWYALSKIATGAPLKAWGFLKTANKVLIVSAILLIVISLFGDPLNKMVRVGAEIVYAFGLGIPLFIHIANILRQVKYNFKSPAGVALMFSMFIYLFGVFIAYGGFNNDTRVPAHYHGAVTALTLALMGFGYHMIVENKLRVVFHRLARVQPYVYGVGMVLFITGLFVSGLFGAPRKTHGVDWTDNPVVIASMTLMGVGTLLAVIGGAVFVLYVCATLLKQEPVEEK